MVQTDNRVEEILRLFLEIRVRESHIHLTSPQCHALFGHDLTAAQAPEDCGRFLAREQVTLLNGAGSIPALPVVGPARDTPWLTLSCADACRVGLSGESAAGAVVAGNLGKVRLRCGLSQLRRQVCLTPEWAAHLPVTQGQQVQIQVFSRRPVIFQNVSVCIRPGCTPAVWIDREEANACGLQKGDLGRIRI